MTLSRYVLALALSAAFSFPVTARADTSRCELSSFNPTQVVPLRVVVQPTRHGGIERLVGAQLFVPAQPGLTSEWLRATLERHIIGMNQRPMAGCPLGNAGTNVAVVSGSTGFWVQISSNDSDTAKKILQEADALVRQPQSHR